MTRRTWLLALAMLSLTAGGVWAGLALANAHSTKASLDSHVSFPT